MTDPKVKVQIDADASKAKREFEGFSSSVRSSIGGVQSVAGALHTRILALGSVLAGSAFVVGIKNQIDLMDATRKGAQVAGVSVQVYDELRYAAKLADVEQEVLTKSLVKLSTALVKVAGGDKELRSLFVDTLKIRVQEAGGAIRATDQVLEDLAGRFESMEDGSKKVALAVQIFGEKLGPRLIPFLNQGKAGIQELREEIRKLTGVMTDEHTAAAEQFKDNMARVEQAAQKLYRAIANTALPTLVEYSNKFLQASSSVDVLRAASIAYGEWVKQFWGLDDLSKAKDKLDGLEKMARLAEANLAGVQRQMGGSLYSGSTLPGVADKLREKLAQLSPEISKARAEVDRLSVKSAASPPSAVKKTPFDPDAAALSGVPVVNRMAQWEAELAERRVVVEEKARIEGTFHELSLTEEAAYWAKILTTHKLSEAESLAVRIRAANASRAVAKEQFDFFMATKNAEREALGKNYELRIAVAEEAHRAVVEKYGAESKQAIEAFGKIRDERQKFYEQNDALRALALERLRAYSLEEIDTVERNAQLQLQLGLITQLQLLDIRRQALAQREAIEIAAKQAEIAAMAGGPEDPVAYERLQAQLAEIRARYKGLKTDNEGEKKKEEAKPFEAFFGASEAAIEQGLQSMVMRMQITLSGLRNTARQIGAALIQELVTKPIASWIVGQARMVVITALYGKEKVAAEGQTAAQIMAINAGVALRDIAAKAAQAAAAVYASIAAIQGVGPFLAPAMAAGAFLAVGAFARRVFSAEGGFDIPKGMNPMTQLHSEEMVLPREDANTMRALRGMVAGGGGGWNGQVRVVTEGRSGNVLFVTTDNLAKCIKDAVRNFQLKPADLK